MMHLLLNTEAKKGGYSGTYDFPDADTANGQLIIAGGDGDNLTGDKTAVTLNFKAKKAGTYSIDANVDEFFDKDANDVAIDSSSSIKVTVKEEQPASSESSSESSTEISTEKPTEISTEKPSEISTEKPTETTTKSKGSSSHSGGGSGGSRRTTTTETTTNKEVTTEATTKSTSKENTTEATTKSKSYGSDTIRVSIGSNKVTIGNKTSDMDVAPYIQKKSMSTMVPLRFVSLAIIDGNTDSDSKITWDGDNKTATIFVNNGGEQKVIQFTAGSSEMVVNGTKVKIENNVEAEITDNRMFIPFRALGSALGVEVDWESSTKTAIFIK
jgi:hypothetical protein